MRAAASLVVLATLCAGCGSPPGTRPYGPPQRMTSASYDIGLEGRSVAQVKVWTLGRARDDASPRGELEVHLRVRNVSDAPLRIDADAAKLEVRTETDPLLVIPGPARVNGAPVVRPGGIEWVGLVFELPARAHPDEVTGYELLWSLETEAGRVSRTTTFVGEPQERGGYSYYASTFPFYGLGGVFPYSPGAPLGPAQLGPGTGFYGYWW